MRMHIRNTGIVSETELMYFALTSIGEGGREGDRVRISTAHIWILPFDGINMFEENNLSPGKSTGHRGARHNRKRAEC